MEEQIYDSRHTGQEVDEAVEAVKTEIPQQLTQIGSNLDEIESDIGSKSEASQITASNVWEALDELNIQILQSGDFRIIEEKGFYIVDEDGYIGFGIQINGTVLGSVSYRTIEEF